MKQSLIKIIKNLFAILVLLLLLFLVNPAELLEAVSNITPEIIIFLLLISILLIYISALKWKYFIEALGGKESVFRLFGLYIVGYFINLIMPSFIGGDAVRSWYASKKGSRHDTFAATIMERYTGFAAMIILALIFVWFVDGITSQIKMFVLAAGVLLAGGTLVAVSPKIVHLIGRIKRLQKIAGHLAKIQEALIWAGKDKKLLFKAFLLSFLFHTVTVVNTAAAAYAVGWYNPDWMQLFVVLPLIMLISAVPLAPNGLGLQEGAFCYFLHLVGATPAEALGVALILRAKAYFLALIGYFIWLRVKFDLKSDVESEQIDLEC